VLLLRLGVALGSVCYVVGGWVGWENSPARGFPVMRAHELAGVVGEWIWLGAAPMLAAAVAPFTARWVRVLWLGALAALLYVVWAWRYGIEGSAPGYPFFPPMLEGAHWGLWLSLAGALVALATLVSAWILAATGSAERRARWQLPAFVAVFVLVAIGVVVARGTRDATAERSLRAELVTQAKHDRRRVTRIRVLCRRRLARPRECGWEVDYADGSSSGGVTRD
jgi:hypothetical protein